MFETHTAKGETATVFVRLNQRLDLRYDLHVFSPTLNVDFRADYSPNHFYEFSTAKNDEERQTVAAAIAIDTLRKHVEPKKVRKWSENPSENVLLKR